MPACRSPRKVVGVWSLLLNGLLMVNDGRGGVSLPLGVWNQRAVIAQIPVVVVGHPLGRDRSEIQKVRLHPD